jgi:hypothetical protein
MHLLHQALDQDSVLKGVVADLSGKIAANPLKHAIVLDLNPFWLAAYRLTEAGFSEEALVEVYENRFPFDASWQFWRSAGPFDLSRRFKPAATLTNRLFGKREDSPFMLRIFAIPAAPTTESESYRRRLDIAASETPLPTVVENQEVARLLANPGDRVYSANGVPGTLGGFLRDGPNGPPYAVTGGHVIAAGMAATPAGHLGVCAHAALPKTLPSNVVCHASCGFMTELDVALINVHGSAVANVATSVAQIVNPGDVVSMDGATSPAMRYEVGGAVVEHAIGGCCWNKLFLFHAPVSVGLLPVAVNVALSTPPKDGDSGAWLLRNGVEWVGMVVAGNALLGFALAGTLILNKANVAFNTQLRLA